MCYDWCIGELAIKFYLVGVDENMAQEWKIYSLPMDEEFLGTIRYDASLPLFVEGMFGLLPGQS